MNTDSDGDACRRGAHGSRTPDEAHLLRFVAPPSEFSETGKVRAIAIEPGFQLGRADRETIPVHLSVWVERCTTPDQARGFLPAASRRRLAVRLTGAQVRAVQCQVDGIDSLPLDALWLHVEPLGMPIDPLAPGACGHAGLTNLDQKVAGLPSHRQKALRKALRLTLAERASQGALNILPPEPSTPGGPPSTH